MAVGKGEATSFWFDKWCGDFSLKDKFPLLSEINNEQKTTVARMASSGWRLTFRWWLNENLQSQLRKLKDLLTSFAVKQEVDTPKWIWDKSGTFTVKLVYEHMCVNEAGAQYILIWWTKLPLKIKIWLWLIEQNAILTKDNLARRNWSGDLDCLFFNSNESIAHLFIWM